MGSAADTGPSADSADLAALRREYGDAGLDTPDLEPDPVAMFRRWMQDTIDAGLHEPNAMVVSTVSAAGRPSARILLLKGVDERGFVFYTNYESRKGRELLAHPQAAMCFHWQPLERQVRIEGSTRPVAIEEADAYFATRARGSQIGAWASLQSEPMARAEDLAARVAEMEARFEGAAVPRPPHWSGFRLVPNRIE